MCDTPGWKGRPQSSRAYLFNPPSASVTPHLKTQDNVPRRSRACKTLRTMSQCLSFQMDRIWESKGVLCECKNTLFMLLIFGFKCRCSTNWPKVLIFFFFLYKPFGVFCQADIIFVFWDELDTMPHTSCYLSGFLTSLTSVMPYQRPRSHCS